MVSSSTEEVFVISLWLGIYGIRDARLGTLTHQVAADGLGADPRSEFMKKVFYPAMKRDGAGLWPESAL